MILPVKPEHHYDIIYYTDNDPLHEAKQEQILKHLMEQAKWLESEKGRIRGGSTLSEDVSVDVKMINSEQGLVQEIEKKFPPALIVFDESVKNTEVESFKHRCESQNISVLNIKHDNKPPILSRHWYSEMNPEVAISKEEKDLIKLHEMLAGGVMMHHNCMYSPQIDFS